MSAVFGNRYDVFVIWDGVFDISHYTPFPGIALSFLDVVFVTLDDVFGTWNVYLIFGTVVFCIWR